MILQVHHAVVVNDSNSSRIGPGGRPQSKSSALLRGQVGWIVIELLIVVHIFAASMRIQARGNQVTARDLLDRGTQRVDRAIRRTRGPGCNVAKHRTFVYALGLYDQAIPLLQRAYQLRTNLLGEGDLRTAESAEESGHYRTPSSKLCGCRKIIPGSVGRARKETRPQ